MYPVHGSFSPQLCVGFLFLILYPEPPPPPSARLRLPHICHIPSVTYINLTHNFATYHLSHTITSHTNLTHNFVTYHLSHLNTQLCHIPSFTYNNFTHQLNTHNFVTYHLSHTITSHTHKLNTQLCRTLSIKYHLVTYPLSHTITSHTTLSHTICQQPSSTFVLRGRRGTYGTGWRAWAGFGRP